MNLSQQIAFQFCLSKASSFVITSAGLQRQYVAGSVDKMMLWITCFLASVIPLPVEKFVKATFVKACDALSA